MDAKRAFQGKVGEQLLFDCCETAVDILVDILGHAKGLECLVKKASLSHLSDEFQLLDYYAFFIEKSC